MDTVGRAEPTMIPASCFGIQRVSLGHCTVQLLLDFCGCICCRGNGCGACSGGAGLGGAGGSVGACGISAGAVAAICLRCCAKGARGDSLIFKAFVFASVMQICNNRLPFRVSDPEIKRSRSGNDKHRDFSRTAKTTWEVNCWQTCTGDEQAYSTGIFQGDDGGPVNWN